jgi:hypothetical protein
MAQDVKTGSGAGCRSRAQAGGKTPALIDAIFRRRAHGLTTIARACAVPDFVPTLCIVALRSVNRPERRDSCKLLQLTNV